MVQPQTITAFFDNIAEAQQAVQLLLDSGFTQESIDLLTQPGTDPPTDRMIPVSADKKTGQGRFLFALFGNGYEGRPGETRAANEVSHRSGAFVTVSVQSPADLQQATDILNNAGAVSVNKETDQQAPNSPPTEVEFIRYKKEVLLNRTIEKNMLVSDSIGYQHGTGWFASLIWAINEAFRRLRTNKAPILIGSVAIEMQGKSC